MPKVNIKTVLYLSSNRLPTEKANGYQIMNMCRAFANMGTATQLVCPYRRQKEIEGSTSPFDYYNIPPVFKVCHIGGLDWLHILGTIFKRLKSLGAKLNTVQFALNALRYSKSYWEDPTTVYYSRDIVVVFLLSLFQKRIKGKIIYEAHAFPGKKLGRLIPVIQNIHRLVCLTGKLKALFVGVGWNPEKVIVAHDAVDLRQFAVKTRRNIIRREKGIPSQAKIVGYIGRFQSMGMEKGIPELIQALGLLLRKNSNDSLLLLCVGGPMHATTDYRKLASKIGVGSDKLKFIPRVPNHEVPNWIKLCDVVTIPWSWNEFSAYYTSPMKMFEYMAAGEPIVASDLPSLREILTHEKNALLYKPDSVRELADSLERILSDQKLSSLITCNAMKDVEGYTWDNRAAAILMSE